MYFSFFFLLLSVLFPLQSDRIRNMKAEVTSENNTAATGTPQRRGEAESDEYRFPHISGDKLGTFLRTTSLRKPGREIYKDVAVSCSQTRPQLSE